MTDWRSDSARFLIMADGHLDPFRAKTAVGLLRYRASSVVAILDRQHAGGDPAELLGVGEGVPILSGVEASLSLNPTAFVIGVAPSGGRLPLAWRPDVLAALSAGMDVVSGLHERLADDEELANAAANAGSCIHDIRNTDQDFNIAAGRARTTRAKRVLTVGSDCNVGKMVAALELTEALKARGKDARFVATGQTGILISGGGVCVDAVVSDFVAGAAETIVLEQADADVIVVEGQGSLFHPGFSGVTLGLMHGVMPDCMVLVHEPGREYFRRTDVPIPRLGELIAQHEAILWPLHPSKVVGVALSCPGMNEAEARQAVDEVADEMKLPATDCLRFGADALADAVLQCVT